MAYAFHKEDVKFLLSHKQLIFNTLDKLLRKEKYKKGEINFIFCSDPYLKSINKKFLQHNYFTDIITFDYTTGGVVSGDIYISVDRVKDNAKTYSTSFNNELARVIFHGVLHLCGYKDKSPKDAKTMREKEDYYLSLLAKIK